MDNAEIARTLDAYAALLDLAGAGNWSVRAYRRAADLVPATPAPVGELVRSRRVRELRGIGPGIERRLRELVETGRIDELEPELVALGRYLGIGPQRLVGIGRTLGIRTAGELRAAAEAGRLRDVPGIGPATEATLLAALAREPGPARRGLTRNRAATLAESIATPLEAVAAGELRRGCELLVYRLAFVSSRKDVLDRFVAQLSLHAGQRLPRGELTARMTEAMRHPAVRCLSHPRGRILNHRPPNALDLGRTVETALETGVAGLGNMRLAVTAARRGEATAADILDTRPLPEILRP